MPGSLPAPLCILNQGFTREGEGEHEYAEISYTLTGQTEASGRPNQNGELTVTSK